MNDPLDGGGPAFPVQDASKWQAHGVTKRELFAAILMHSEAVTCGVPGEPCEELILAAERAGRDPIAHMAHNAVEGADLLLQALAVPPEPKYRELYASEQRQIDHAVQLANAVNALKDRPEYQALPADLRERINRSVDDVLDPEIPF